MVPSSISSLESRMLTASLPSLNSAKGRETARRAGKSFILTTGCKGDESTPKTDEWSRVAYLCSSYVVT